MARPTTRELIDAIRNRCPAGADPDEFLANALDRAERTRTELAAVDRRRGLARADAARAMAKLDAEADAIRKGCPHWTVTREGDPAGGSDRSEVCDQCGHEFGGEYRRS